MGLKCLFNHLTKGEKCSLRPRLRPQSPLTFKTKLLFVSVLLLRDVWIMFAYQSKELLTHPPAKISACRGTLPSFCIVFPLTKSLTCGEKKTMQHRLLFLRGRLLHMHSFANVCRIQMLLASCLGVALALNSIKELYNK